MTRVNAGLLTELRKLAQDRSLVQKRRVSVNELIDQAVLDYLTCAEHDKIIKDKE